MADDPQQQSVQASGWWGRLGVTGPNAFPWLVIIILLCGLGYVWTFSISKWGEPVDLKGTITAHTERMGIQHDAITEAMDRFTYVQWICSPLNTNSEAKRMCSELSLLKPKSLESMQRR